jgi:glyoxylase-like metal-dependent hydrolase (beta-lactamase superfamily II)
MDIGEIEVLPIVDGNAWYTAPRAYAKFGSVDAKGAHDEEWSVHRQFLDDEGRFEIVLGGYLVRTGNRVMLIDAGIGLEDRPKAMTGGALIESLAARGVAVADVTDVLFTHLHGDHIGWASNAGEVVFPNATYRCHQRDWDHFFGDDDFATRKLTPTVARFELFGADITVAPGVDVRLAAGHTPGSVLVVLSSGSARALLIGDVAHCPVELIDDEWAGLADVDPKRAQETRNALARELEGTGTPFAAAHFPGLEFGRLITGEGRRQWVVS